MNIRNYFSQIEEELYSCPLIISVELQTEIIDRNAGYYKARAEFSDGSELHLFEYINLEKDKNKTEKYRYHYQDEQEKTIYRWDNANHHPEIKTYPHHLHVNNKVIPSKKPTIEEILTKITENKEKTK